MHQNYFELMKTKLLIENTMNVDKLASISYTKNDKENIRFSSCSMNVFLDKVIKVVHLFDHKSIL